MNDEVPQAAALKGEKTHGVTKHSNLEVRSHQRNILAHATDLANIITITGLFCAILGIYFAVLGVFSAAIIALLWATFCDWFDGPVARRMKGRTNEMRALGGQLDSLVDIISGAIGPAMLLLSVGKFNPWFIPGAFAVVVAGVLRLSYFNVFGLEDESTYLGLPIDHNIILLSLVFLLEGEGVINQPAFAVVVYVAIVTLAILGVLPFRMPKVGGLWYYAFTVFVISLTVFYSWRLCVA